MSLIHRGNWEHGRKCHSNSHKRHSSLKDLLSHGVTCLSWSQTPLKVVSSVITARLGAQLQLSCPKLPWKSTPMQHIQKRIAYVDMQRETIRIKKKITRCYWPCLKESIQMIEAQLCGEERKKTVFRCFCFKSRICVSSSSASVPDGVGVERFGGEQ